MSKYANLEHDYAKEGSAYCKAQLYPLAIQALNKAIELAPDDEELYNELGLAYFHQNEIYEAKQAFEKALECGGNSYKSYNNLAWIYHYNDENDKALDYFNEALKLAPLNFDIILNCGDFYFSLQKFELSFQAQKISPALLCLVVKFPFC